MTAPDGRRVSDEDAALDAMLASWAARHAPTAEHLEAIRRAVLEEAEIATGAGVAEAILPLEWWERFFSDLQAGIRRAASLETVFAATAGCAA